MTKAMRAILVLSLVLNVGFLWFRSYVGSHLAEGWVALAQAEQSQLRNILGDIESGDPNRIAALEEKLRKQVEMGEKNLAMIRQMAR